MSARRRGAASIQLDARHLQDMTRHLDDEKQGGASFTRAVALAELMGAGYRDALGAAEPALAQALAQALAEALAALSAAREEIARLAPNRLGGERLPEAGRELDLVMRSTEEAADIIMASAEAVLAFEAMQPDAYRAEVEGEMIRIMEACAFQDLTGQRIAKVAETLRLVEERVCAVADALAVSPGEESEAESAAEQRRRELILNGPAAPDAAMAQDEIDRILAG